MLSRQVLIVLCGAGLAQTLTLQSILAPGSEKPSVMIPVSVTTAPASQTSLLSI